MTFSLVSPLQPVLFLVSLWTWSFIVLTPNVGWSSPAQEAQNASLESLLRQSRNPELGFTGGEYSSLDSVLWKSSPIRQASVNIVSLFWQYIDVDSTGNNGRDISVKAMKDASQRGFTFYRFAASAFWPVQLQLWFNMSSRHRYWEAFDLLISDAESIGVKLVPSILWNHYAIPDLCHEPFHRLFEQGSCSYQSIKKFTEELVSRYQNSSVVLWWELGNELNLLADLDMENRSAAISPPMGTPTRRTKADNFSTDEMIALQVEWAGWIRALDKKQRPISSGFSTPRVCAEHLRRSYYEKKRDWTYDSEGEFAKNLIEAHKGLDIVSVHLYNGNHDNLRFNISKDPDSAALFSLINKIVQNASKILHIGEYGNPSPGQRQYSRNVLQTVVEQSVAMSTIWVWEFFQAGPGKPSLYSLLPSRDEHFIKCMQEANQELQHGGKQWTCTEPPDPGNLTSDINDPHAWCPDYHFCLESTDHQVVALR